MQESSITYYYKKDEAKPDGVIVHLNADEKNQFGSGHYYPITYNQLGEPTLGEALQDNQSKTKLKLILEKAIKAGDRFTENERVERNTLFPTKTTSQPNRSDLIKTIKSYIEIQEALLTIKEEEKIDGKGKEEIKQQTQEISITMDVIRNKHNGNIVAVQLKGTNDIILGTYFVKNNKLQAMMTEKNFSYIQTNKKSTTYLSLTFLYSSNKEQDKFTKEESFKTAINTQLEKLNQKKELPSKANFKKPLLEKYLQISVTIAYDKNTKKIVAAQLQERILNQQKPQLETFNIGTYSVKDNIINSNNPQVDFPKKNNDIEHFTLETLNFSSNKPLAEIIKTTFFKTDIEKALKQTSEELKINNSEIKKISPFTKIGNFIKNLGSKKPLANTKIPESKNNTPEPTIELNVYFEPAPSTKIRGAVLIYTKNDNQEESIYFKEMSNSKLGDVKLSAIVGVSDNFKQYINTGDQSHKISKTININTIGHFNKTGDFVPHTISLDKMVTQIQKEEQKKQQEELKKQQAEVVKKQQDLEDAKQATIIFYFDKTNPDALKAVELKHKKNGKDNIYLYENKPGEDGKINLIFISNLDKISPTKLKEETSNNIVSIEIKELELTTLKTLGTDNFNSIKIGELAREKLTEIVSEKQKKQTELKLQEQKKQEAKILEEEQKKQEDIKKAKKATLKIYVDKNNDVIAVELKHKENSYLYQNFPQENEKTVLARIIDTPSKKLLQEKIKDNQPILIEIDDIESEKTNIKMPEGTGAFLFNSTKLAALVNEKIKKVQGDDEENKENEEENSKEDLLEEEPPAFASPNQSSITYYWYKGNPNATGILIKSFNPTNPSEIQERYYNIFYDQQDTQTIDLKEITLTTRHGKKYLDFIKNSPNYSFYKDSKNHQANIITDDFIEKEIKKINIASWNHHQSISFLPPTTPHERQPYSPADDSARTQSSQADASHSHTTKAVAFLTDDFFKAFIKEYKINPKKLNAALDTNLKLKTELSPSHKKFKFTSTDSTKPTEFSMSANKVETSPYSLSDTATQKALVESMKAMIDLLIEFHNNNPNSPVSTPQLYLSDVNVAPKEMAKFKALENDVKTEMGHYIQQKIQAGDLDTTKISIGWNGDSNFAQKLAATIPPPPPYPSF